MAQSQSQKRPTCAAPITNAVAQFESQKRPTGTCTAPIANAVDHKRPTATALAASPQAGKGAYKDHAVGDKKNPTTLYTSAAYNGSTKDKIGVGEMKPRPPLPITSQAPKPAPPMVSQFGRPSQAPTAPPVTTPVPSHRPSSNNSSGSVTATLPNVTSSDAANTASTSGQIAAYAALLRHKEGNTVSDKHGVPPGVPPEHQYLYREWLERNKQSITDSTAASAAREQVQTSAGMSLEEEINAAISLPSAGGLQQLLGEVPLDDATLRNLAIKKKIGEMKRNALEKKLRGWMTNDHSGDTSTANATLMQEARERRLNILNSHPSHQSPPAASFPVAVPEIPNISAVSRQQEEALFHSLQALIRQQQQEQQQQEQQQEREEALTAATLAAAVARPDQHTPQQLYLLQSIFNQGQGQQTQANEATTASLLRSLLSNGDGSRADPLVSAPQRQPSPSYLGNAISSALTSNVMQRRIAVESMLISEETRLRQIREALQAQFVSQSRPPPHEESDHFFSSTRDRANEEVKKALLAEKLQMLLCGENSERANDCNARSASCQASFARAAEPPAPAAPPTAEAMLRALTQSNSAAPMMRNLSPEAQALAFFQQNAPATDHSQDRAGALAQLLSLGPSNSTSYAPPFPSLAAALQNRNRNAAESHMINSLSGLFPPYNQGDPR
jgi:hypothetical protein